MKNTIGFALALALLLTGSAALTSRASAQVIIQGEVTVQSQTQPQPYGYTQPQPVQPVGYGASPYVSTGGSPPPARYIHRSQSIAALWVPGIIALGVGWLGGALIATGGWEQCSGYGCPSADWVGFQWIPVIGPWLALGLGSGRDWEPLSYVTGIVEDVGLLLFILGLAIHDEWDEPIYAFGDSPDAPAVFLTGNGLRMTF